MDPTDRLGSLFGIGFEGAEPDPVLESGLRDLAPRCVVLFARNLRSPSQARDLVTGLREVAPGPLLLAVDQEGGRVDRLGELLAPLRIPPASRLGQGPPEATREVARAIGAVLAALDLDWDLAPVMDLDRPGTSNGIGDRSYSPDTGRATEHGAAFLEGLEEAGVLGCLKHFPGLGPTRVDTHRSLAVCPKGPEALWGEDVEPFRRLSGRAGAVMVGHAAYPAVTGREDLPASLSPEIVTRWLRERLAFDGVIVSDDLEMGALAPLDDAGRAVGALRAGCDLILFCREPDRARRGRDAVLAALKDGSLDDRRLAESALRVSELAGLRDGRRAPRQDLAAAARSLRAACEAALRA